MKKYIYLLFTVLFAGGLSSCKDALDLPDDGRIDYASIFADRNRTMGYLNKCYGYMPSTSFEQSSAYTDDAQSVWDNVTSSGASKWYKGEVGASNWIFGFYWSTYYAGIRYCNVFIQSLPSATAFAQPEEKEAWMAQAKCLRAFYYLRLIQDYGPVPLITEPYGYDHDYSKDRRTPVWQVVQQILKDTEEALAAAGAESMSYDAKGFRWVLGSNYAHIMHRAFAYMIRSQAALLVASPLYAEEEGNPYTWAEVAKITKEALDQCLSHDYALSTRLPLIKTDSYNAYDYFFLTSYDYSRATDKETIYQLNGSGLNVWQTYGLPTNEKQTSAGFCPSQELVDSYETADGWPIIEKYSDYGDSHLRPKFNTDAGYSDQHPYENRDPRFYGSIYFNGALRHWDDDEELVKIYDNAPKDSSCAISSNLTQYTRTGYYLRKFNKHTSTYEKPADGSLRTYRLAELYLNFAEAANEAVGPTTTVEGYAGQPAMSAVDAVNAVRARAGMPGVRDKYTTDAETFRPRVRNERRVEFAFEELRYNDIRRWKALDQAQIVTGMRAKKTDEGTFTYTRFTVSTRTNADSKYLLSPLPFSEVTKMYKLTGLDWQNPGYESAE
ncbi:MAG: RagB/SusD family nutrient uptake outer membrane protein [Alistipes sp.]|nr:RagB/SusD family nutrient uptake outer membrane protein [Alistipes sp.]